MLSISCEDCALNGTSACEDCVVTFLLRALRCRRIVVATWPTARCRMLQRAGLRSRLRFAAGIGGLSRPGYPRDTAEPIV